MSTKLNEHAVAGILLDNYAGADDLILRGNDPSVKDKDTVAVLKENAVLCDDYTFAELAEAAKDCGDPLFLWIVNEVKEGSEKGNDPDFPYDADLAIRVLRRAIEDLNKIVGAFENL